MTPTQSALFTLATRAAAPALATGAGWAVLRACAARVTATHTLAMAAARAVKAVAASPTGASADWVEGYAREMGRTQRVTPAQAAAWATEYVRLLQPGMAPAPPVVQGKYRQDQPLLFQACAQPLLPPTIPGEPPLVLDTVGPTWAHVSPQCGWSWMKPGADWTDADGVPYGPKAWGSVRTDPVAGGAETPTRYSINVTGLVNHCIDNKRWLALMLRCAAARDIAGNGHADRPHLVLQHTDGRTETVPLWVAAGISPSSRGPVTHGEKLNLPALLEFPRPSARVASAHLAFVVLVHWSGSNTDVGAYLLTPPLNTAAVQRGVELQAGLHDAGIDAAPGVIGALRLADGTTLDDIHYRDGHSYSNEAFYSPDVFDIAAPVDKTRVPHVQGNRFAGLSTKNCSVVPSTYTNEGFVPVASGLGALRVHMPPEPWTPDTFVGSSGSTATTSILFLPDAHFGRLKRIFVRYYFRLGTPYGPRYKDCVQQWQGPGQSNWATMAGKCGLTSEGTSSWGGVSGSSGGPYGWQMRNGWTDCIEAAGPETGGIASGFHFHDFDLNQPLGHRYGGKDWPKEDERWGSLGGMLYAGHWYCLTTELSLNTAMDVAPGYQADGVLRQWIDGRLAWQRDKMVFRTGPAFNAPPTLHRVRPARELGVKGLWIDVFHGGKTWNTYPRTHFYAAMAWGTEYIGPINEN